MFLQRRVVFIVPVFVVVSADWASHVLLEQVFLQSFVVEKVHLTVVSVGVGVDLSSLVVSHVAIFDVLVDFILEVSFLLLDEN